MKDTQLETINDQLLSIIQKEMRSDLRDIPYDGNLNDLGLDSLDMLAIIDNIESHFHIKLNDDDFEKIQSMESLRMIVLKLIAARDVADARLPV